MIYFNEGDVVSIKHLDDSPLMVVKRIEKMVKPKEEDSKFTLLGIKCYWFDKNHSYQEASFNTKDLKLIKESKLPKQLLSEEPVKITKIRKIENM